MAGFFEKRREKKELKEGFKAFKPLRNVLRAPTQEETTAGVLHPVQEMWKIFGEQTPRFKELFFNHLFHNMLDDRRKRIEDWGLTPEQLAKTLAHDATPNNLYLAQVTGSEGNPADIYGLHAATVEIAQPILGKSAANVLRVGLNRTHLLTFKGVKFPKDSLIDGLLNSIDAAKTGTMLQNAIDAANPAAPARGATSRPPTGTRQSQIGPLNRRTISSGGTRQVTGTPSLQPGRPRTPASATPPQVDGDTTDEVRDELERITAPRTLIVGALAYAGIGSHRASDDYHSGKSADSQKSAVGRLLHDARDFAAHMHVADIIHMSQEAPTLANAALNAPNASEFVMDLIDIATHGRQRQRGTKPGSLPHELEQHVWDSRHELWDGDEKVTKKFHLGNIGSLKVGQDAKSAIKLTDLQRQTVAYLLLAKLAKSGDKEKAPDELVSFTRNAHLLETTHLTRSIEHDLDEPVIEPEHLLDAVGAVALEMQRRRRGGA